MAHRINLPPDHGEPIELEKRKPLTPKQRAEMFAAHGGICCLCNKKIMEPDWIDEHLVPVAIGHHGETSVNDQSNRGPAHIDCAKKKTTKDRKDIAKAKRLAGETKTGPKPKIQSRGFATNRDGPMKKKMDGSVVKR